MTGRPTYYATEYYDYRECRDFLQARDGYDERDYAGRFHPLPNREAPYRDFWHFVVDRAPVTANGCHFIMSDEWKEGAADWQMEILERYLAEFGEVVDGQRQIKFYVSW